MCRARLPGVLLAAVAFVAVAAMSALAPQDAFVGTWVGQTQVPEQGTDQVTLAIAKGKTGLTGTVVDSLGMVAANTPLKDVAIVDGELTGSFALTDGAVVVLKLKLDGDKLKGRWEHQSGDVGELVFERKK